MDYRPDEPVGRRAQEVYDKELQLHQINKELIDLSPGALDNSAQRKRLQNQAAAEKANAAKLDAIIEMGTELVQEATENEEFDAAQLEAWAETLMQLEEIAVLKMPSVAELLQQAAEAQRQPAKPTEPLPPGQPTDQTEPAKPSDEPPAEGTPTPPGGEHRDLEKADKYGPDSKHPPEGLDEKPEDPNAPGGDVNVDRSKQPDGQPGYLPANPTPLVLDHESGFNKSETAGNAPQIKGGLGIPTTVLKGSGNEEDANTPPASTAELVLQAVTEQQELLDAFAAIASDLSQLLMGLENSTFVKRLKAASREQMDLAVELNELDGFGFGASDVEATTGPQRKSLAEREVAAAETVFVIQEDLDAYADRKPSDNYARMLKEMQEATVVDQLRGLSDMVVKNDIGQSTIEAEYWTDTLDRWAEQLVDPLKPHSGPPPAKLIETPNLMPAIILEVLRIIDREMQLREETRELQQARAAMEVEELQQCGTELSEIQQELAKKSRELAEQIKDLPDADHPVMQKLKDATVVMDEVADLLKTPSTGPPTIAAISEVLEILLETARLPNAPMVVKAPPATTSALMLIGLGNDEGQAFIEDRAPRQATGMAGRKLPEEFRRVWMCI